MINANRITENMDPAAKEEIRRRIRAFNRDAGRLDPKERTTLPGADQLSAFGEMNEVYGAADVLSIRNAVTTQRTIALLSALATLLTLAFLLYDEVYLYGMILACGILLVALFVITRISGRLKSHQKYLEYRLLAEGLRVQYYLCTAGIRKNVSELLPWSWQFNVPWTKEAFEILGEEIGETGEKRSVLDLWIRDQKEYHEKALIKTERKAKNNDWIVRAALLLAVLTYIAALIFEIRAGGLFSGTPTLEAGKLEVSRIVLKVLMGTFSAMTLFAGNYYGKLSLEDTAMDHRRMAALYDRAEQQILREGETEDLLIRLAREELAENSRWYAYQCKNKPGFSL